MPRGAAGQEQRHGNWVSRNSTRRFQGTRYRSPEGTDRLYWACGVTPSLAAQQARLPLALSYTPGHALITDIPTESLYKA